MQQPPEYARYHPPLGWYRAPISQELHEQPPV